MNKPKNTLFRDDSNDSGTDTALNFMYDCYLKLLTCIETKQTVWQNSNLWGSSPK